MNSLGLRVSRSWMLASVSAGRFEGHGEVAIARRTKRHSIVQYLPVEVQYSAYALATGPAHQYDSHIE